MIKLKTKYDKVEKKNMIQHIQDFGADPGEACIKSQDYISS